ncbi:MAG TPA: protein-L-isoaspartate(D-aspartate) O-methyltransferase [Tepidisphaeraceae bacterium]|jgi:protein-L-isoaspartate(D-aspartate) O-methyltransferase
MLTPADPSEARERMVERQIVARGIKNARVIDAMRWVPRERFFPEAHQSLAFEDAAAPIGHGQTISQPYIVAYMTEALQVETEHKILEIGTGSGYQAAILAKLGGEVYTVERVKVLLDDAFERLSTMKIRNVHFKFGDGSEGWPEKGPYDRIIITAATPAVADTVLDQLADGGICVAPVGNRDSQELVKFVKRNGRIERHSLLGVRFVPLLGTGGFSA